MASLDKTGWSVPRLLVALLLGVLRVNGLEVSTGKVSTVEAMNGSTVLILCTYNSCIGIRDLFFTWHFNGTVKLCEGRIPKEGVEPKVKVEHKRVEFVGSTKSKNISILLWNITFDDDGEYTCFAKNPKEKGRNHSAVFTLKVVNEMQEVDNTLTTIIVAVLGGVIGLAILAMVIKALVVHFLLKGDEKNKECLVNASGNDNTENGLTGAKADNKGTPKA
ncbi:sodium channel subunit beta-4-like [Entelurus aequoreus]|uniref:sodium channel subunit beta-4-like n=1 Tax=Entelurus aequoreus TaxID=161455 RepID=UPI002B1D54E3|nr:sodium channel subunit beta-4-like [Entelurus aequoreus]XP_061924122.1 sodium channel subunit beta-4-like [Entelurus aequoreus]